MPHTSPDDAVAIAMAAGLPHDARLIHDAL